MTPQTTPISTRPTDSAVTNRIPRVVIRTPSYSVSRRRSSRTARGVPLVGLHEFARLRGTSRRGSGHPPARVGQIAPLRSPRRRSILARTDPRRGGLLMQEMPLLLVLAPGCILLVAFALLFGLGPKQLADENDDDDDEERDHRPHIYACRYCREPIHVEAIR